ncbi:hypothetical protein BDV97DRAFT_358337 [Delphinella strobiligena]|nr:hypothetical protein BDV97DRAFT_358337 [Delphinella strobiligena]
MLKSTLISAICALLALTSTAQLVIPDFTRPISNAIKPETSTDFLRQPDTLRKPSATEAAYRSSNLAIFTSSTSRSVSRLKGHGKKIPELTCSDNQKFCLAWKGDKCKQWTSCLGPWQCKIMNDDYECVKWEQFGGDGWDAISSM